MIDNFIEIDSLRCRRFPFETRKTETFFFFFVGSSLIILSFFSLISASQPVKTQRVIQSTAKDITLSFFLLFLCFYAVEDFPRMIASSGKKQKTKQPQEIQNKNLVRSAPRLCFPFVGISDSGKDLRRIENGTGS